MNKNAKVEAWIDRAMELAHDFGVKSADLGSKEQRAVMINDTKNLHTIKVNRNEAKAKLWQHLESLYQLKGEL